LKGTVFDVSLQVAWKKRELSMTVADLQYMLVEHFQAYAKIYIGALVVLLPVIIIFRRWSIPLIQYVVELVIYLAIMHIVLWGFLHFASWFKDMSAMDKAFATDTVNPGWTNSLIEFWDRAGYNPPWIFYVEIVFAIIVVVAMYRVRPLRPQKRKQKIEKKKMGESTIRKYKPGGE